MKKINILSLFVLVLMGLQVVPALYSGEAYAEKNISRSYSSSSGDVPSGSVVALEKESGDTVILANTSNADRTVGVVVRPNESLVGIDPSASKLQVATSGLVRAMVSTVRGEIRVGDKISVSALSGAAQKSSPGEVVVGFAKSDFLGTEQGVTSSTLTNTTGETKEVKIGIIDVELAIGSDNPLENEASLNGVQQLVKSLTGKTVSTPRIIASIVIAVLTLLSLAALLYASIYGSIISIGRNPLVRGAILRGLAVVLVMAGFGVLLSMAVIYFLLR